jgi:hypothetical protein
MFELLRVSGLNVVRPVAPGVGTAAFMNASRLRLAECGKPLDFQVVKIRELTIPILGRAAEPPNPAFAHQKLTGAA